MVFGDKKIIEKKWEKQFGYKIDFNNLHTLNEKIQWLKLYDRRQIYTLYADKLQCRYLLSQHFGDEHCVPLLFKTNRVKDINKTNITTFPCIIKPNNGSGLYHIFRSGKDINWKHLRRDCKTWLKIDYYSSSQEYQYHDIKPYIIVEKLLLTSEGKIPNDYKLHYINGQLEFIYCSIDREGLNYRQIYDSNWNKLPFNWSHDNSSINSGFRITMPHSFELMKKIGSFIAADMKYVRVDFFDVDGFLYYGEITLYHGSGFDPFTPEKYDLFYGEKISLK
ncbi:MAG: ATP-grasp fold amidoligase family protein [Clostridia bacterium]|nr:ATP-grasp fold amidoligase family protein [Clostridia bacterium]